MLTLYIHPLSTPALSVMFGAKAMAIEHECVTVDLMTGEQRSDAYLKINPMGKVPMLVDGDFSLFESGAILKYMAKTSKSACYPEDIQAQAHADQWLDYVHMHVRTPFTRVQFNRLFAERLGQEKNEKSIEFGLHILSTTLPTLETQIAKQGFVCGDHAGLADYALLATLDPTEAISVDLSPYPALMKWRAGLKSQAFYTDVHSHYGLEIGM